MAAYVEAQRATKAVEAKRAEARLLRKRAARLRALSRSLDSLDQPEPGPNGTVGFRRSQPKIENPRWPFYQALAERKLSVPDWARSQKDPPLSAETARNWMKPRGGRPIPAFWAKRIERDLGVPAVPRSWPHGIRDQD